MSELSATGTSPADIESRQDDLLRQLDALEKRIDRVLADYAASGKSPARAVMSPNLAGIAQPPVGAETAGMTLPFSAAPAPVAG